MNSPLGESPNSLLQKDPGQLLLDLDGHLSGPHALSVEDGHALAEGAGFKAMTAAREDLEPEAKQWATIALKTYEALSLRDMPSGQAGKAKRGKFRDSAMTLRSAFIGRYGEAPGDFILDPARLKDWFMGGLDLDLDSARDMASKWKTLPATDIQRLRTIKNRLKSLRSAMAKGSLGDDADLKAWKDLEKDLP